MKTSFIIQSSCYNGKSGLAGFEFLSNIEDQTFTIVIDYAVRFKTRKEAEKVVENLLQYNEFAFFQIAKFYHLDR